MNVQTVILIISRSISRFVGNFSFISKAMNEKDMNNIYQNVILSLLRHLCLNSCVTYIPFLPKNDRLMAGEVLLNQNEESMALLVSMGSLLFRI